MRALLQKLLTWPQDMAHACIAANVVEVLSSLTGQSRHTVVPGKH
jgi:hypothetical protein